MPNRGPPPKAISMARTSLPRMAREPDTMIFPPAPLTRRAALAAWLAGLASAPAATAQDRPSGIAASKADLVAMSPQWKGERSPDGRPKVPEDLLRRMKAVSIEEAWDVLRQRGYD